MLYPIELRAQSDDYKFAAVARRTISNDKVPLDQREWFIHQFAQTNKTN